MRIIAFVLTLASLLVGALPAALFFGVITLALLERTS